MPFYRVLEIFLEEMMKKVFLLFVIFVLGLIGEGAFSQVFRGNFHGSEVAVKRLRMKLSAQEKNYFAAEVKDLAACAHCCKKLDASQ